MLLSVIVLLYQMKGFSVISLYFRFYEWQQSGKSKQPYFIFFKDNNETTSSKVPVESTEEGCSSTDAKKLVTMAGLFDKVPDPTNVRVTNMTCSCVGITSLFLVYWTFLAQTF